MPAKVSTKLVNLVIDEARLLKETATKAELDRLSINVKHLNPDSPTKCIYGQMTGDCETQRATDLIKLCCQKVYEVKTRTHVITKSVLNGSPKDKTREQFFSPIEVYIFVAQDKLDKLQNLLSYLKGKKETLTKEDLI